jgi:hypothetical protein
MSNQTSRSNSPFDELFSGDYKKTAPKNMSNQSSRSNSPIYNDFDKLFSGDYKKTAPKTPPRTSSLPKGFSPLEKSIRSLHNARHKISSTLREFPEIASQDSQGSMDSGKTDSVYSDDDEFSKKLEREAEKQKEISRKMREQIEERKKLYATMSDEEVEAAEKKRMTAQKKSMTAKKINDKLTIWGNKKHTGTIRAGRRKKRRTRKNNKRKKTQKKNKRKNKKSKRKTRSKRQRGGDEKEDNKFVVAAMTGNIQTVTDLLKNKVNVDTRAKENSWTALIWASRRGHTDIVKLLLDNGANVNFTPYSGVSALHLASKYGHTDIVKLLLNRQSNVNAKTAGGFTALITASEQGNIDIVTLLLQEPLIDVNVATTSGRTALIWASEKGHTNVVKLLKNAKISREHKNEAMKKIQDVGSYVPSLAGMARNQITSHELKELRNFYPLPTKRRGGRRKKTQKKNKRKNKKSKRKTRK